MAIVALTLFSTTVFAEHVRLAFQGVVNKRDYASLSEGV